MSEHLAMEVGKAVSQSERAIDRADEAWQKAHKTAGFVQTIEHKMGDHDRRISGIEREQDVQRGATEKLSQAVDRLAAKLPAPKSATQITREVWRGTSRQGRAGIIAALTALFTPQVIDLVKEVARALGTLAGMLP